MMRVLMFHRVLPESEISSLDAYWLRGTLISTDYLQAVIRRFDQNGFEFLTLKEAVERTDRARIVVCTFDDGYEDSFIHALPVLREYGVKASFYPIFNYCFNQTLAPLDMYYHYVNQKVDKSEKAQWIGGGKKQQFLNLSVTDQQAYVAELLLNVGSISPNLRYMTVNGLIALDKEGHEIGGHSLNHSIYTLLTTDVIEAEIRLLKNEFNKLGISLSTFAYPDGQYDLRSVEVLRKAGFIAACTIKGNRLCANGDYEIEREFVHPNYLDHGAI